MPCLWGALRRSGLGIPARKTSFEHLGFCGGPPGVREHLAGVVAAYVNGYHAALEEISLPGLVPRLEAVGAQQRGFAYEGAATALALLDFLTPWRRHRWRDFLAGAGSRHTYLVHVGVGWLLARVPGRVERHLARLDPLLRWLAVDGYGFHEGFFHWPRCRAGGPVPGRLEGYARRAFDQGLGRCLWFIHGADVARLPETVAGFPAGRRPDLWSGVGLASTYAGGVGAEALRHLRVAADPWRPCLAQGAAFAAKARLRAGIVVDHTRVACQVLCGLSPEEAAQVTDAGLENLPADDAEPAYEVWRKRVQERFK